VPKIAGQFLSTNLRAEGSSIFTSDRAVRFL